MSKDRTMCGVHCSQCKKAAQPGNKLLRCEMCLNAYYCDRECQKKHRKQHKESCVLGDPIEDMDRMGKTDKHVKEFIRSVIGAIPKKSVVGETWDRSIMIFQGGMDKPNMTLTQTYPALPLPGKCTREGCDNDALKSKCSRCHVAYYCSRECQVSDWKNSHKHVCKRVPVDA